MTRLRLARLAAPPITTVGGAARARSLPGPALTLALKLAPGLALAAGLLSGCTQPASPDADPGRAYATLVQPLAPPETLIDRPEGRRASPPGALAGSSWDEALRLGSLGRSEARAGDGLEDLVTPERPAVPLAAPAPRTGAEADADGAVSLYTGVGDDAAAPIAAPLRVQVPRVGIDSNLDPLGLKRDGELEAPPRWKKAGWFTGGPRPGERGPAVIAGHLDSPFGGAVFAALPRVRPGDEVVITDVGGTRHVFSVTRIARTPKQGFPTREVYGAVPGSELRLITCTGEYLPSAGGYQDNLLVFARLVR